MNPGQITDAAGFRAVINEQAAELRRRAAQFGDYREPSSTARNHALADALDGLDLTPRQWRLMAWFLSWDSQDVLAAVINKARAMTPALPPPDENQPKEQGETPETAQTAHAALAGDVLLTTAEVTRRYGISRTTITRYVRRGLLRPVTIAGQDGRYQPNIYREADIHPAISAARRRPRQDVEVPE